MSLSTNMALADAWLNADVALTKRTKTKELNTATDAYNLAVTALVDAQEEAVDQNDFVRKLAFGISTIYSAYTGGLGAFTDAPLKAALTAFGAGSIASDIAGGLHQDIVGPTQEMERLSNELENLEVQFSSQSTKYDSDATQTDKEKIERAGDSRASDFSVWSKQFYSGLDDYTNATQKLVLSSKLNKG